MKNQISDKSKENRESFAKYWHLNGEQVDLGKENFVQLPNI